MVVLVWRGTVEFLPLVNGTGGSMDYLMVKHSLSDVG